MGKIQRRLIALLIGIVLFALSLLPSLFQGGSPPPTKSAPERAHSMTGMVRTARGGPAPRGTRVRATGGSVSAEVSVEADGSFRIESMPEGTDRFEALCGPLRASVPGTPPVEIRLPGELDVTGRVVCAESGDPVEGARVSVGEREVHTDERGRFAVAGVAVPDGEPPVIGVTAPGYHDRALRPRPYSSWDDLFLRLVKVN